jgi:hypothetical protein
MVINGIHAGEVEGKEASMMLCREILAGSLGEILEGITLVMVPLFNPDGNDAMDPGNRKFCLPKLEGQLGPDKVGTRVNSQGINLNRDYIRQEAPEMRLLQQVFLYWQPDLCIDNHATNGSVHRFYMTYDVPHTSKSGREEPILYMRESLLPAVTRQVQERHGIESGWYGNFIEDERALDARKEADPEATVKEGWITYPHNPRFGANYRGMFSRLDLLLECYSYLNFKDRVRTAYAFMLETFRYVGQHRSEILALIALCSRPREQVAIGYTLKALPDPVTILTRSPRTLEGEPAELQLPYLAEFTGKTVVKRPYGYLVPASLEGFLKGHGLPILPVPEGMLEVEIPVVESQEKDGARAILEAAEVGQVQVSWKKEKRRAFEGAILVSTEVRQGALACYLLEPESDDGVLQAGFLPVPEAGSELPLWRFINGA